MEQLYFYLRGCSDTLNNLLDMFDTFDYDDDECQECNVNEKLNDSNSKTYHTHVITNNKDLSEKIKKFADDLYKENKK